MKLIFLYVHSLSMQYIYIDARALVFLFVVDVGCDVCVVNVVVGRVKVKV